MFSFVHMEGWLWWIFLLALSNWHSHCRLTVLHYILQTLHQVGQCSSFRSYQDKNGVPQSKMPNTTFPPSLKICSITSGHRCDHLDSVRGGRESFDLLSTESKDICHNLLNRLIFLNWGCCIPFPYDLESRDTIKEVSNNNIKTWQSGKH